MASNIPGISTNGTLFGYGIETTAGTKPTAFTLLHRINAIGGVNTTAESIDASALEDAVERTIAGRESTGGTFNVTVNLQDDTIAEWVKLISDSKTAKASGKSTWFEIYSPSLAKSFFIVAEPPSVIPSPEWGQNSLLTAEMTLTINEYKGLDTAIKPTEAIA